MAAQEKAVFKLLSQFKKRPVVSGVLCLCVCAGVGAAIFFGIRASGGQKQNPSDTLAVNDSQTEKPSQQAVETKEPAETEKPTETEEVTETEEPAEPAETEEPRIGGNTYYVDSSEGLDTNDGKSESTSWQSINKLNDMEFLPGDKILLKAGSVWDNAIFKPNGSGTSSAPIIVDAYGDISVESNKPLINANQTIDTSVRGTSGGSASAAIIIKNVEYWEINNLQLTNNGDNLTGLASCYGVLVTVEDFGTMEHIYIRNLYIRDVYGKIKKSNDEGTGIFFRSVGPEESKLNDLRIEYNHLERVSRNGIGSIYGFDHKDWSSPYSGVNITKHPYRHTNVFIRGNQLDSIAGDGIKAWGCDGALVEYNIIRGAELGHIIHGYEEFGTSETVGASAGIWPFDSDNTIIQYNEVSGVAGTMDGQAFDIDFFTTNTIIQYNYSHHNMGGFLLLCSPGWAQSSGNVVRYNISQNDGSKDGWNYHLKGRLIQHGGGNTDTQIYNNTFYIGAEQSGYPLLSVGEWEGGFPQNVSYTNNVFIVESSELTGFYEGEQKHFENIEWESNVFIGAGFSSGELKNQMPANQTVYTDVDLSDFFYGAGNAMFGRDTAIAAYTPLPGTVLENGGAVINEEELVTLYHFGNGNELTPGDGKYPFPLYWFTNYNTGLDFAGNEIVQDGNRGIGAISAGQNPNILPAPVITGIEDTGNGIKVSFEGVSGADSYKLIYGKYVGFGYGAAVLTAAGDAEYMIVNDFAGTGEYFFTICGISENNEGFYSSVKRHMVSDVILDTMFGENDGVFVTRQTDISITELTAVFPEIPEAPKRVELVNAY